MHKWMIRAGGVLLVGFAGWAVWQYLVAHGRFEQNVNLVAELATAEFLEEEPLVGADWPQWRGQRRDGHALPFPLIESWPARGPDWAWEVELGEGWSAPVVVAERVYYFFRHDNDEVLRCVDLNSGESRWEQRSPVSASFEYSSGPRSTPCVVAGKIYTVGINGRLQCRLIEDGKLVWEKDFQKAYAAPIPKRGATFSPMVEDGLLLLNPGGPDAAVVACRADTGEDVWRAGNDSVGYSSPMVTTIAGRKVIVLFTAEALTGWNLTDGRELFSYPWPTAYGLNPSTPILFRTRQGEKVRHYVFISSGYNQGCALLHLRPRDDGTLAVEAVYQGDQLCSHFGSPVRIGDYLYGFDESRLVGLDLRTGKVKWRRSGFRKGALCALGDHLVVFGEDGEIGIGPASREREFTPSLGGRVFRGRRCWTMPVVAQGRLLVRSEETGVCIDLRRK